MKTAYLIYYADPASYEYEDRPFAIAESEERAKTICAEIIAHGQKIADQMLYPYEDGISDDEWRFRENLNQELLDEKWPFDWEANLVSDFSKRLSGFQNEPLGMTFDANTVAYKELPKL